MSEDKSFVFEAEMSVDFERRPDDRVSLRIVVHKLSADSADFTDG